MYFRLARAVNCEHPVDGNPCGVCPACRGISEGSVLDVVELDAASNNSVDNVRALRDEAVYSPASVKKRVYIIDEVHMLSVSAFNALLKILEEPPANTLFILTTSRKNAVMPTILSRLRPYNFSSRTAEQEKEIIERVFHDGSALAPSNGGSVLQHYLEGFLPVRPEVIEKRASEFFDQTFDGKIPDIADLIKNCEKFEPRVLFRMFLSALEARSRQYFGSAQGTQKAIAISKALRDCFMNVSSFNQSIQAALEELFLALAKERGR